MFVFNSFTVDTNYNFGAQWPNRRPPLFLADNKTFEGICLALPGKFRQKELWILFVFKTILEKNKTIKFSFKLIYEQFS